MQGEKEKHSQINILLREQRLLGWDRWYTNKLLVDVKECNPTGRGSS